MTNQKTTEDWWKNTVVYHVYLPSFKDSNGNGVGDFPGLTSKLDYLVYLNVQTLMISPFFPSPMLDNGYDIIDYYSIDPRYGTMEDFDHFLNSAKKYGMNVLLDFPINHTSSQHEWFLKSLNCEEPYKDYFVWVDPKIEGTSTSPPNNWLSVFGGSAWEWRHDRQQFYLHQFLAEQPDLNLRNPLVRSEIKNIFEFWLMKGIDGFRIDAASHLYEDEGLQDEPVIKNSRVRPDEYEHLDHIYTKGQPKNKELMREWRKLLSQYAAHDGKYKVLLVEVVEPIADSIGYYGDIGKPLADVPFNFSLTKLKSTSTGIDLHEAITSWLNSVPEGKVPNWMLGNHDLPRIASKLGQSLAIGIHMVTMLLPGIIFAYYGDELGMENRHIDEADTKDSFALRTKLENSRDPARTPMQWSSDVHAGFSKNKPWLPVHENYTTVNVEMEKTISTSHLEIFRKLMSIRKEHSILYGEVTFPFVDGNIFSMARTRKNHESFLVIVNMGLCTCIVDMTKSSQTFPKEAILQVTNQEHCEKNVDDSSKMKNDFCRYFNTTYKDITHQWMVKLCNVMLLPKEAVVLSYRANES